MRPPGDLTASLVAFHVVWFGALLYERVFLGARMPPPAVAWPLAIAALLVEGLRAWILATLGSRWTIQIVVVPGEAPVRRGPYRFLRHPNYVVVFSEVVLVSLLVGARYTASVAWVVAGLLLVERIRREEAAWREHGGTPLRGP